MMPSYRHCAPPKASCPAGGTGGGRDRSALGAVGDHKGPKLPRRQITLLALKDWQAACAALHATEPVQLPWTVRRANVLVVGVRLPRAIGAMVAVGPVVLEITFPTSPCRRMDDVRPGLMKALHADWRGGVTTRVLAGGPIRLGDPVTLLSSPPELPRRHLPG